MYANFYATFTIAPAAFWVVLGRTGRIQVIKVDMYLSEIIISLGAILFRARPPISARFLAIARVNIDARGL